MWAKLICEKISLLLIRLGHQHSYAVFVSFYDSQRQEESWKIYGQVVVTLRLASQWFVISRQIAADDVFFSFAFAGVLYESATKNKMIACLTCLASLIRSFLLLQYMQKCIFGNTKFTLLLHCRSVTTINSITVQKICVLSSLDRLIQIKSLRLSIPLKKKSLAR